MIKKFNINDYVGKKYNKLTVISFSKMNYTKDGWKIPIVKCLCECGTKKDMALRHIKNGGAKSCGCIRGGAKTHGMTRTAEFRIWMNLINRCYRKNVPCYRNYGARGILVSDDWRYSFEKFYLDMGNRPGSNYSIDRINNDGNYCKENCRWATRKEQAQNRRENPRYMSIEYKGKTMNLKKWTTILNLNYNTVISRMKKQKMSFSDAIK